ncbi:sugar ABC transporter ATP-binding protein [Diplocloster modestus]|uniref:Sugar ABC transporter ATP-binding protein n=1 Tax=Diplocloster modestus TaxID=2850322 RepID=A0ABS6K7S2_9FIRM|nr:sugar ABC transporter ATP-binding protein [Diplocloster modestus]MBU9726565.1 sugar ABC transporter ATP-binding protein [Diplocloster modestus]
MEKQIIMQMKHITKRFPGVLALDDVNFEAYAGEILALCGENGAGKSTLMKILSGSYPRSAYEGKILIEGKECRFTDTEKSERAGIAMIYQEISMHLDETVAENIFMGRWKKKKGIIDWKWMNQEAQEYIAMVGLRARPQELLRNLSTSQQQLVAIARALTKNPRILVLDEPTSPLTIQESDKLFSILHRLKKKGIACILITHKLGEVFANADRVVVMRDGRTISASRMEETSEDKIVSEMVGRKMESYYPKETAPIKEVVMEVKNVTVAHPYAANKNIVEDVSFSLRKGEILGIGGLVGAGRSELVDAVFGKIRKNSGELFVDGRKVTIKSPADAIRAGIALVTEDRKTDGIVGGLSIRHNIALASLRELSGYGIMKGKKEKAKVEELFSRMGIKAPGTEVLLQQLSGGNQQKVVLCKWLMRKPKILILDEPTRGIDVGAKAEIYKIMVSLAKEGIAIIMISSELPELISMSDRVLVLAEGKLAGELAREECTQEKIMMYATNIGNQ